MSEVKVGSRIRLPVEGIVELTGPSGYLYVRVIDEGIQVSDHRLVVRRPYGFEVIAPPLPEEWPPERGDLWKDANGDRLFCHGCFLLDEEGNDWTFADVNPTDWKLISRRISS